MKIENKTPIKDKHWFADYLYSKFGPNGYFADEGFRKKDFFEILNNLSVQIGLKDMATLNRTTKFASNSFINLSSKQIIKSEEELKHFQFEIFDPENDSEYKKWLRNNKITNPKDSDFLLYILETKKYFTFDFEIYIKLVRSNVFSFLKKEGIIIFPGCLITSHYGEMLMGNGLFKNGKWKLNADYSDRTRSEDKHNLRNSKFLVLVKKE